MKNSWRWHHKYSWNWRQEYWNTKWTIIQFRKCFDVQIISTRWIVHSTKAYRFYKEFIKVWWKMKRTVQVRSGAMRIQVARSRTLHLAALLFTFYKALTSLIYEIVLIIYVSENIFYLHLWNKEKNSYYTQESLNTFIIGI